MQYELVSLQARVNKTIIFITHDLDEAINIGSCIVLMKDRRVVRVGTAEEILVSPANDYVARFNVRSKNMPIPSKHGYLPML